MVNKARGGGLRRPDRRQGGGGGGGRPDRRPQQRGDGDRQRSPRKCANCCKDHEQRACPHPAIAVADRACWTCGKKGNSSAQCPGTQAKGNIKAIEDAILPFFGTCNAVMDKDGFSTAKKVVRPTPRGATLGDFVPTATRNRFSAMEDDHSATTVGSPPARSQPDIDIITTRAKPAISSPTISKSWGRRRPSRR